MTDIVDFRVTSPGLTAFLAVRAGGVLWSDTGFPDCDGAGEARMVLNLFLARSDPVPFLVDINVGRLLRGVLVVLVLIGRELFVVVRNGCLAEAPEPSLPDPGLLSAFVLDANIDL